MRILILGAGYAGLTLTRRLESLLDGDVEIVLVDEHEDHLVQHELHRLVRLPDLEDDITVPIEEVVDRAEVRQARVTSVDADRNEATFADGGSVEYDYAAVCLGAETAFYGLDGVEEHATPLKRVEHAELIRESYLDTLAADGRAVVGGAGLSGIQVAGELATMADERGSDAEVVLLEQLDAVAPAFPENFQAAVREQLAARDVSIRTGTGVADATAEAVELDDGERLDYDTFVWTGGITGPAALGDERPLVRKDLRLDRDTFVVGDAATVVDVDGEAVPASAQSAVREARVVAKNLAALVDADRDGDALFDPRMEPFGFDSPGWLVSVGDGAVAQIGPTVLTGRAALAMKATVGAGYLSSVGAIRNAVELVNEELGLDVGDEADLPDGVGDLTDGDGPIDAGGGDPIDVDVGDADDEDGDGGDADDR